MDLIAPPELEAFHRGDPRLFRRIVQAASPRLMGTVRPFVRDLGEAEDLVQEAWRRAFLRRADFRGHGSLMGWLLAIARNLARGHVRGPHSRETNARDEVRDPGTPETVVAGLQLRRALQEAVAGLPERQRETLVLRIVLGFSTRETAQRLECAEGTVKAALAQALAKLRITLKEWET